MSRMQFIIGSYAKRGTPGILRAVLDEESGQLELMPLSQDCSDPSWVEMHPKKPVLYAVEETPGAGAIAALIPSGDRYEIISRLPSPEAPCHISVDPSGAFLLVSNYMAGALSVYRLDADGRILEQTEEMHHHGHGPNADRQEAAHVHSTLCIGDVIYAADLGQDVVFRYHLDTETGRLEERGRIAVEPGAGPRHMLFAPEHPDTLYVNAELNGYVYQLDLRKDECVRRWRIIPEDFSDEMRVSSIKRCGNTIYIGSREFNAVTLFHLDPDGNLSGRVTYRHTQETPRDVYMDEHWCLTADEGSFGITLLRRDGDSLRQEKFFDTPGVKPTCIQRVS